MRHLWRNGGKGLVLATLFFGVAVGSTVAVLMVAAFWPDEVPFTPLSVSNVTINSRVEGFDGPAVRAGGHYNGTVTICNENDEAHTITFIIQFERLDGPVHFVSGGSLEFPIEPGCDTLTGDSAPLPDRVTPGPWREATSATVQKGDQKQTISFVSDAFQVVP
jgi:hypothetical protein